MFLILYVSNGNMANGSTVPNVELLDEVQASCHLIAPSQHSSSQMGNSAEFLDWFLSESFLRMARRKTKDSSERQTAFVGFWITPTQAAELDAAAERQGASRSEFARELVFRRLGAPGAVAGTRCNPDKNELVAALRRAAFEHSASGNNLNQIARHLNMTGELRDWTDLREAVALFKKAEDLYIAALEQVLTP
jgi:hypothetical protein